MKPRVKEIGNFICLFLMLSLTACGGGSSGGGGGSSGAQIPDVEGGDAVPITQPVCPTTVVAALRDYLPASALPVLNAPRSSGANMAGGAQLHGHTSDNGGVLVYEFESGDPSYKRLVSGDIPNRSPEQRLLCPYPNPSASSSSISSFCQQTLQHSSVLTRALVVTYLGGIGNLDVTSVKYTYRLTGNDRGLFNYPIRALPYLDYFAPAAERFKLGLSGARASLDYTRFFRGYYRPLNRYLSDRGNEPAITETVTDSAGNTVTRTVPELGYLAFSTAILPSSTENAAAGIPSGNRTPCADWDNNDRLGDRDHAYRSERLLSCSTQLMYGDLFGNDPAHYQSNFEQRVSNDVVSLIRSLEATSAHQQGFWRNVNFDGSASSNRNLIEILRAAERRFENTASFRSNLVNNRLNLSGMNIDEVCMQQIARHVLLDGGAIPCPNGTVGCAQSSRNRIHAIDLSNNRIDIPSLRILLSRFRNGNGSRSTVGASLSRITVTGNPALTTANIAALRDEFSGMVGSWQMFNDIDLVFSPS